MKWADSSTLRRKGLRCAACGYIPLPLHTACWTLPPSVNSLRLLRFYKMPSFSYSAALRIDNPSLVIETTHFLVHDLPSETTHMVYGSVPTDVDVLLASDLVISISGTLDRVRLSSMDISKSAVALHLKRYLETVCFNVMCKRVTDCY